MDMRSSGATDAPSDREVLAELVTLHARVLARMPVVQLFVVIGLGFIVYPSASLLSFCGWAALTLGAEALRAWYALHIRRNAGTLDPVRVHFNLVLLATLAGAAVAVGAICFMPLLPPEQQVVFAVALFVMPAAGVAVANSSQRILGAYALSILLPAASVWGWMHPQQMIASSGLTLVYCVFLIVVAADGEQLLRRSIVIRSERDQMVRQLERSNANVREAMVRAEQSAEARARVLASASHDLRQPLHALSIYGAILAADPEPETLREVGRNIDQIIRALGSLLTGLLDLSRLSVGHYVAENLPFALDRVVAGICDEFEPMAAAKQLALQRQLQPIVLRGDSLAVARICRNLLDNAIKYTERGEVRVETYTESRADGDVVVLRVVDTGKGIPLHEQNHIFEEFYQIDNPGRDRSKGVGLGLAIVQRLAELIRANISVQSEPESGTAFQVEFAVTEQADAEVPDSEPEARPMRPFNGRRIYVVDDEADILKSMRMLLELWGASVRTAATSMAAEELLRDHGKPDLLIIDLRLGRDEHGARLASRQRELHAGLPILIITGETASHALREAKASGFAVLQKPIAPEALRAAIAVALDSTWERRSRDAFHP